MTSDQQLGWCQSSLQPPLPNQPLSGVAANAQAGSSDLQATQTALDHYRTLYESNPSIYFTLDSTGQILSVNQFGAARLGYTAEELVTTSIFQLFHPSDRHAFERQLTTFLQSATPPSPPIAEVTAWEFRQIRKDGSVIWVKALVQLVVGIAHTPTGIQPTTTVLLICEDISERKQIEVGLQQEQNFIAAVLDTTSSLIIVLDPQGRIVRFNRACERITGYSFTEIKGIPFWDFLLTPEEVEPVKAGFQELRSGQFPNEFENYWVTRDGQRRLIAWSNTAIVGEMGSVEYVIGTGIDVTEQREAELALERSQQQQYQQLVDSIEGIVWAADAQTWQFSLVSQKAEQILGYAIADWLSEPNFWVNHIHPQDCDWVLAYCSREVQARRDHSLEYRMVAQDGRVVWLRNIITVVPESNPPQLRGVMIDITERRQAEMALQTSEARYRAVVEQATEGIFLIDCQTKRLLEANAACRSLLGYSAGELLQLTLYDIVAHDRDSIDHNIHQVLHKKRFVLGERQYRRKDGSLVDVEVSASLLNHEGRNIFCVVIYDVTAYKQTATALEKSLSLLKATVESTADGILAVSNKKEIVTFNRKFVDMWQIPLSVMNSTVFEDRIAFIASQTQNPSSFLQQLHTLYHQPDLDISDVVHLKDGRIFERYSQPQRVGDRIVGRVWSFRDITKRTQAEAALAKSEAKWRSLILNSSDLIAILEADGTVRYQSPSVENILGYEPQELLGRNAFDFVHPEDIDGILQAFQDLIQGIISPLSIEFRFRHKDGSWRFLQSTGSNLLAEPAVMGIVINSRDITERKRAERALQRQTERERLMRLIAQRIHQSLHLEDILDTTVAEVRQFLQTDRAIIFRLNANGSGVVSVESVATGWEPILGRVVHDPCLVQLSKPGVAISRIKVIENVETAGLSSCYTELLDSLQVKASLVVPIMQGEQLWGLLIAHHCQSPRQWQSSEVNFLDELATQVAIAIQQSELYQQVQRLNADLESQVIERTAQLQQALDFEAMLKRITDKVRDSLDEGHILQTAVQELVFVLGVACCDTALYDADYTTSTICYEYTTSIPTSWGRVLKMADFPEIYGQLLQGQYFQFCEIVPNPCRTRVAMLACPIFDDQGVIGDLWLFKAWHEVFDELEIRLVQQVTNQCAIAIRQARLYQAAQQQVQELEKLNRLKDDFLSTVSHELRTPVCNIKMAIQMLELSLNRDQLLSQAPNKTTRYLQVLKDECDREISLINDLLDLQRLDAGAQPLTLEIIHLREWVSEIVRPFYSRAQNRQQQLHIALPDRLPPVVSHTSSLARILAELLNNACKYTPPGESITVAAIALEGVVQVQVSNCGVEIPTHELPHIFDKFYRVPSTDPWKQGGTGLGLALVQKLTEHLGGRVEVKSEAGTTCFTVELPLHPHLRS